MTVWRNEEGRQRLERWYDRFRERIPGPVESRVCRVWLADRITKFLG